MKCGDDVKLKIALVAFAVALVACIGTIPTKVEANGVEELKIFGSR